MATNGSAPKTTLIKAIFTNLLFVVGVILMVVGFVMGMSTLSKFLFFDVYPLPSYEEQRCEYGPYSEPAFYKDPSSPVASESAEAEAEREAKEADQKTRCLKEIERSRSVKKVEDVVSSISFFIAGLALTFAFKQFIFGKR